jgi:hypothetical protein
MDIQHALGVAFLGTIWTGNAVLGGALLVAPRWVLAVVTQEPRKVRQWLFLAGALVLANTVMAIMASLLATIGMRQLIMDLTGGFR